MLKEKRQFLIIALLFLLIAAAIFLCAYPAKVAHGTAPTSLEELRQTDYKQIASLPEYDSRNYGIVTPVKDQGDTNLCWAYASIAASETSILRKGIDPSVSKDTLSLSPTAVGYGRYNRGADPLGNTEGEATGANWAYASGNPMYAIKQFAQGYGPISNNLNAKSDGFLNGKYQLLNAEKIESSMSGVKENRIAEIKEAIAKYGAVTFSYNNLRNAYYYNPKNEKGDNYSLHACTLIGWDDNIEAAQFTPGGAKRNGGFLVKNSYSDLPYFYLSYDCDSEAYAFDYALKEEYQNNYFYDHLNDDGLTILFNTKYVANVFEAKCGSNDKDELLKAVNVSFNGYDTFAEVFVYTNLTDITNPESGTLAAYKSRHFQYAGFQSIMLDSPILLDKGSYFAIAVRVSNNSDTAFVNITPNGKTSFRNTGSWNTISNCARIKALTTTTDKVQIYDISQAEADEMQDQFYSGSELRPEPKLSFNGTQLTKERDYTLRYENNTAVGVGKITVSGLNSFVGEKVIRFNILPYDIGGCSFVFDDSPLVYNGLAQYKNFKITFNGVELVAGRDYFSEYTDCINSGTVEISICGIGNFVGNKSLRYQIEKAKCPTLNQDSLEISKSAKKLGDVPLPDGYKWENPDADLKDLNKATIVYVGDDADNYNSTKFEISLHPTNGDDNSTANNDATNNNDSRTLKIVLGTVVPTVCVLTLGIIVFIVIKKKRNMN